MARNIKQKGIILIFVLWGIFVILFTIGVLVFHIRTNTRKLNRYKEFILKKQYIKNGLIFALSELRNDQQFYNKNSLSYENGLETDILIQDCGSLINLNFFPMSLVEKVPYITPTVLEKIQSYRKSSNFITHLCMIDPQYYKKKWKDFVTVSSYPIEFLTEHKQYEKLVELIQKKKPEQRMLLTSQTPLNINTIPEKLMTSILDHLGMSSREKEGFMTLKKQLIQKPIKSQKDFLSKTSSWLGRENQKKISTIFSHSIHFFKITVILKSKKTKKIFKRLEAVIQKIWSGSYRDTIKILQITEFSDDFLS